MELSPTDAAARGIDEGDLAEVETARGRVRARVRVGGVRAGVVFVPFHYGYWDRDDDPERPDHERAANELTPTAWDAASKQPIFKTAAARVRLVERGDGRPAPAPTTAASAPVRPGVAPTTGGASARSDELLEVAP
jgi:predicted molibdopterin-dependent oxidoreductase YjgC